MSRSNLSSGETPRFFFGVNMDTLSIFVDESGDFGDYNSKYAPHYIFSMVFHEQKYDISGSIKKFNSEMVNLGYYNHVVHTAPLIRREYSYCNLSPNERRSIFTKLFFFAKALPITYKDFVFERKECRTESELKAKIITQIERFIDAHLDYFTSFDRVLLYYDNGQKQLASALQVALGNRLPSYKRKTDVSHKKYKLLQVADMLCTLELLEQKCQCNSLTYSEKSVFHNVRDLRKDFLKKIRMKEFV